MSYTKFFNATTYVQRDGTYHKGCNEEGDVNCIPQRRRRKPNRDEELALDQPVESTSKLGGGGKERKSWAEGKKIA